MAVILNLTDGDNTIDFITTSSDFALRTNGLSLPPPDAERLEGNVSGVADGKRLMDRKWGNREVTITCKIKATDHDALVADIRKLTRLFDTAKETSGNIFGKKVGLHYKLENATDEVIFDVLDGEFESEEFASVQTRRDSLMINAEIVLICRPYARSVAPIRIRNHLVNGGFEHNLGDAGRDFLSNLDMGASGVRLERSTSDGFFPTNTPAIMAVQTWINPTTLPASTQVLHRCGNTTKAWSLEIDSSQKIVFQWFDAGGTHTLTSVSSVVTGTHVCISATIFSSDGFDQIGILMIDDNVEATLRIPAGLIMTVAAGKFTSGATDTDTLRFDGDMQGLQILKHKNILPYQLIYLYKYGHKMLVSDGNGGDDDIQLEYLALERNDLGFASDWPVTGVMIDDGGNDRDIAVLGSPARAIFLPQPHGWTAGADIAGSFVGLSKNFRKYGILALRFLELSAGSTNLSYEQTITLPPGETAATILIWLRGNGFGEQIELDWEGDVELISVPDNNWAQYLWTKASLGATSTFRIKWTQASATDVSIDGVQFIDGLPYGVQTTPLDVTSNPKPFISGDEVRAFPDDTRQSLITIADLPGDAPCGLRIHAENSSADILGPVRIGAAERRVSTFQEYIWRASTWVPINAASSVYNSGVNPSITTQSGTVLTDRILASLLRLIPNIQNQYGSFKVGIGVSGELDMLSFSRYKTQGMILPLSGDPIKDPNVSSSAVHIVDGGLLSWPPEQALNYFIDLPQIKPGILSGYPRVDNDDYTPQLTIANLSDAGITAVDYEYIFLLPLDGGFFTLLPSTTDIISGLGIGEQLVVDTISEDAVGMGYIMKSALHGTSILEREFALAGGVNTSLFGTGFRFPPGVESYLIFQFSSHGGANDLLFGDFKEANTMQVWMEYEARYLYV